AQVAGPVGRRCTTLRYLLRQSDNSLLRPPRALRTKVSSDSGRSTLSGGEPRRLRGVPATFTMFRTTRSLDFGKGRNGHVNSGRTALNQAALATVNQKDGMKKTRPFLLQS